MRSFSFCKEVASLIVTNGSFPLETFCRGHITDVKIWLPIRIVCLLGILSQGLLDVIFRHMRVVGKADVVVFIPRLLTLVGDLDWTSTHFPRILRGVIQKESSASMSRWSRVLKIYMAVKRVWSTEHFSVALTSLSIPLFLSSKWTQFLFFPLLGLVMKHYAQLHAQLWDDFILTLVLYELHLCSSNLT